MTISITISRRMLVFAVAAILFASGAAWVFAQSETSDYIFACIKDDSVRVVVNATDCKDKETALGIPTEEAFRGLESRITALEDLLQHFSRDGDDITITRANLHVVNGTGTTYGEPNSLGNVIIGYNEEREENNVRTGSHMLVVGREHNYSSFGGIVAGYANTVSGRYASVSGGLGNTASGEAASVSGGVSNRASGNYAWVSGGGANEASGDNASVSGGLLNVASGGNASVSGGVSNTASANFASVSGGESNTASGNSASVSGGYGNTADGYRASVSGGQSNTASGESASVSGGQFRSATATYSWRAGELYEPN